MKSSTHPTLFLAAFLCSTIFLCCEPMGDEEVQIFAAFSAQGPDTSIPPSEEGVTIKCGECVRFIDRSSIEVVAHFWDFEGGDPVTSDESGPTVCFANPGKFDVSLSVDAGKDRITKDDFVCVLPKDPIPLVADFSIHVDEIIKNETVQLIDQSLGGPDTWSWEIGRESDLDTAFITSAETNPSVTILLPGSYNVTLTVGRGAETDSKVQNDFFNVLDFTDFNCLLTRSISNFGLTAEHTFNSQNQIIRQDEFLNGQPVASSEFFWNLEGLLEREDLFDENLNLINQWIYNYDFNGNLIQQVFLDTGEVILQQFDFTIQGDRITDALIFNSDGQGGLTASRATYDYGNDTTQVNVIGERFTSEDGQFIFFTNNYEFDQGPNPFFNLQNQPWPQRSFRNNIGRFTFLDAEDNIIIERTSIFTINEFGRTSSESRTSGSTTQEFLFEFDCQKK